MKSVSSVDIAWDYETATVFIEEIHPYLEAAGFQRPQIIGSVGLKGISSNDLDLLMRPSRDHLISMEQAIEFVERNLMPAISDQKLVNPLECADHANVWFVGVELRPNAAGTRRVVEFYLPEDDFPLEVEALQSRPRDR